MSEPTRIRVAAALPSVHPLCLGGNVFGWTADEQESFAVLDSYVEAGGNFIDTADVYMAAAEGNSGGESETILGRWMSARENRDEVVLATKLGKLAGLDDLRPETIRRALEASLGRLGTDHVDLLYAHADDPDTPLADTLGAFTELIGEGKVGAIGASNYSAARLSEALEVSRREELAAYVCLQPLYNLMERGAYEDELREVCEREELTSLPYYGLASGFLTGKSRSGGESRRGAPREEYSGERGERVLDALEQVAGDHGVAPAAVALAWLHHQPTVSAPIASARTTDQLADLMPMATLELSSGELEALGDASS